MNIAIIAAYNEEKTVGYVVKEALKHVDRVVVVDDGSSDNTTKVSKEAGAEMVSYNENQGKAHALSKGIEYIEKYNPAIVVLIDGDGQHLPEEIPGLIKPIEDDKADVVYGVRKFKFRQIKSWLPGKLVDILFRGKDILCGFTAIKYDALKNIDLSKAKGYLLELVLHKQIKLKKLRLSYVPITAIGITRINWFTGIKLFFQYIFGD